MAAGDGRGEYRKPRYKPHDQRYRPLDYEELKDKVDKRKGKHGRVNMGDGNQDRLLLHHPMCMTFPDHLI